MTGALAPIALSEAGRRRGVDHASARPGCVPWLPPLPMSGPGPSLAGVLQLLETASPDKLAGLQQKLRTPGPGGPEAELLRAMVALALGGDEAAARRVSVDGLRATGETPDVSWAVARVYHLLAEEKLCPESARDAAYAAALRMLDAQGDRRLDRLRGEARARCGGAAMADAGGFQPLRSDRGDLPPASPPPSAPRSQPWPISALAGWSRACSLRSSGSPGSVGAELEISQSPTLPFLSPHRATHGPSKLCPKPPCAPRGRQEPEEVSWPSSAEPPDPDRLHPGPGHPEVALASVSSNSTVPPDGGSQDSLERSGACRDPPLLLSASLDPTENPCPGEDHTTVQSPGDATRTNAQPCPAASSFPPAPPPTPAPLPSGPQASSASFPLASSSSASFPPPSSSANFPPASSSSATVPQASSTSASFPLASSSPASFPLASSSWASFPPVSSSSAFHADTTGQKFYNFVILHTRADEHVALRVRERLEALGVPEGATFCEDFQVPGRGELRCLQDAIDHSGFIILLLTAAFDSQLGLHQLNQALMSSLTQLGRQDCVVPFLPIESSEAQLGPDTTSLLAGLVRLDERSAIFARKVANTFAPQRLLVRRAHWAQEQQARALRQQRPQPPGHATYPTASLGAWGASQPQIHALQEALGSGLVLGTQTSQPLRVPLGGQVPPFSTWPGCPQTPSYAWQAGTPPPAFPQPPFFPQPPTSPPTPTVPSQTSGPQPLIIQHAQMVQLGLNNHMWNQRGAPAPQDDTSPQEADRPNDRD
ncbi:TIR domain-containing adapter molecule 1 isoform X2 [Dipodomys merriami]|uniref:TIR domain-containing adapter molecule 1 isoform X2 n=1 Tax=Dipodomys merriami TaxID=94247 RepID=UPI0038558838